MCIAIYKPAGSIISEETLRTCFESNPDGAGFMYNDGEELVVKKGFFTFKDFYKEYKPTQDKQNVIHFRIKTHGEIDSENCHPFNVDNGLAFVHNGVINDVDIVDKDKSDTWHFNQNYLKGIREAFPGFLTNQALKEMIAKYIGYSKLIFLDRFGNANIINSSKGEWVGDIWYSNSSYKSRPVTVYSPAKLVPVVGNTYSMCWSTQHLKKGEHVVIKAFGANGSVWVQSTEGGEEYNIGTIWLDPIEEEEKTAYIVGDILYVLSPFNGFSEDDTLEVKEVAKSGTYFKVSNGHKVAWTSGKLLDENCYEAISLGFGWV